jgi:sec-independent protein translocase protein TatA
MAVVAILVILLFGRGKLSGLMADLGEGINSFRHSMRESGAAPDKRQVIAARESEDMEAQKSASRSPTDAA